MDLSIQILQNMPSPPLRQINSTQGRRVQKYRRYLSKGIKKHQITQRLKRLQKKARWTKRDTAQLQQIDKDVTRIMLRAEHWAQPACTAPWHPKLHEAFQEVIRLTKQVTKFRWLETKQKIEKHRKLSAMLS